MLYVISLEDGKSVRSIERSSTSAFVATLMRGYCDGPLKTAFNLESGDYLELSTEELISSPALPNIFLRWKGQGNDAMNVSA